MRPNGMKLTEIQAVYPRVADAVEWMESADMESMWEDFRQRGLPPDAVLRMARAGSQKGLDLMTRLNAPPAMLAHGSRIITQMDQPEVLAYIKGKLGAV